MYSPFGWTKNEEGKVYDLRLRNSHNRNWVTFSGNAPAVTFPIMCDRYVLPEQAAAEREFLPGRNWWNFAPKFNVGAGGFVPTLRWHDGQSEAAMMRWGFIPSWAEGESKD